MRIYISSIIASLFAACGAHADERDQKWDALIAAAKERGAVETRLDRSASYVFQQPDGSYLSLTRLLKSDKGRSICWIAKDENTTGCLDWVTAKFTFGYRDDIATPWRFKSFASFDEFKEALPTWVDRLDHLVEEFSRNLYDDQVIVIIRPH